MFRTTTWTAQLTNDEIPVGLLDDEDSAATTTNATGGADGGSGGDARERGLNVAARKQVVRAVLNATTRYGVIAYI